MYIKILKFIITCLQAGYNLLDAATILLSFLEKSEEVENQLLNNLKKEYSNIKKQIKNLTKTEQKKLFNQIIELSNYYISAAAVKDSEKTYDNKIVDKVGGLANVTSDSLYGGSIFLLSCITPDNNNFEEFIRYLKNKTSSDNKNFLNNLISSLTSVRKEFQKDNTLAALIIDTAKTAADIWTTKSQYN